MVIMLLFIFGVGPFFGIPAIAGSKRNILLMDLTYSARPLASILSQIAAPGETVAVYNVRRDAEYGLSFYRGHRVEDYENDGVPAQQHILVVRESSVGKLSQILKDRTYEPLFKYPAQNLVVYSVSARP
jgi:hypothetical protein